MRAIAVGVALLIAACSTPSTSATSPSPSPTASAVASPAEALCKLPVYWEAETPSGIEIRTAFMSVPDGAVSPVTALTPLPFVFGAVFDGGSNTWLAVDRSQLSPDGKRYVYWKGNPAESEIHVVDVATHADRTIYSGPQLYIPIAFTSDTIYVVHAVNPRQGVFELLFILDPAGGGTPELATASTDRHMYQWGWVLISDGAAWGIDYRVDGNKYIYSVLRLDLSTGQVTTWFEGPADDLTWPLGTDADHRLYVQGVNTNDLWRLTSPGQAEQLANPGPIGLDDYIGGPTTMFSDPHGTWFAGRGGVWLYAENAPPKQFSSGLPTDEVYPAGPCV